ncbi:MAG: GNAT family N-acetyltransferase [Gemmatimonadota bacterium]|nr:GNAT family N-acetyltransferase [Gemmatimonadota bacterium]
MNVTHDERNARFVLEHEGTRSMVQYRMRDDNIMHLIRTWVAPEFRGGGFGVLLVREALDYARAHDLEVTTSCWFVDEFLERTPEYQDLRA